MTNAICRSALYMPANNSRALEKSVVLPVDVVILDLEDSVAPDAKSDARSMAKTALSTQDYGYRFTVLRVNGLDTPWFEDDMSIVAEAKPSAVLLPKVESADAIHQVQAQLDRLDKTGNIRIWAMMETPKAVVNAASIAAAVETSPRLSTFCIGNNDLAKAANMKTTSDRTLLMPWLMQLLAVAKSFDLSILDGVFNDFVDLDGFERECNQGAAMGMDGKTLIHPKQIALANTAFSPTDAEIADAQLIVDTFAKEENAQVGVLQINGRMVERLHLDMACQTLDIVRDISSRIDS